VIRKIDKLSLHLEKAIANFIDELILMNKDEEFLKKCIKKSKDFLPYMAFKKIMFH
jgi:hypothetical protein